MTTEEKNIAISKMLEAYEVIEWEGISKPNRPYWKGTCFCTHRVGNRWCCGSSDKEHVIKSLANHLKFHSDANWQFEAIDWIESQHNGNAYNVITSSKACTIETNTQWALAHNEYLSIFKNGGKRKENTFEALYQFSQYLKQ